MHSCTHVAQTFVTEECRGRVVEDGEESSYAGRYRKLEDGEAAVADGDKGEATAKEEGLKGGIIVGAECMDRDEVVMLGKCG